MKLVFPHLNLEKQAISFINDFIANNESEISGDAGLFEFDDYKSWIIKINNDLSIIDDNYMPSSVFFAVHESKIVGIIQIRHKLNNYLYNYGGHIGYSVAPTERRKGYATDILALGVLKCREMGINKILITCKKDNIASSKTILKNGGTLENEMTDKYKNTFLRYWITIQL